MWLLGGIENIFFLYKSPCSNAEEPKRLWLYAAISRKPWPGGCAEVMG